MAFGTASYGAAANYHFDAQKFDLPAEFRNLSLIGIRLTDINPDYNGHDIGGAPFLLAVGVSAPAPAIAAVPEPATWAMMILGMGVVGGAMRRRRCPGGTPAVA